MSKFVILRENNGQFYFKLETKNGQVILTGESHINKNLCLGNIKAVKANITNDRYYDKRELDRGRCYFTLKAKNGHVICVSPNYESELEREKAIERIKMNVQAACIEEQYSRKTRTIQHG